MGRPECEEFCVSTYERNVPYFSGMSTMERAFTQIEERYRFVLPESFREFWRRGFCSVLGPGRPGPNYLLLPDMEWMPLAEIITFEFRPYHLPGFVPFAFTGGGDHWCWQPEFTVDSKTRVLCCYKDCYDADIYAPDFISTVYRHIIENAAGLQRDGAAVEAGRRELNAFSSVLTPFISTAWQQTLSDIVQRTVIKSRSTDARPTDWYFLLSPRECKDILRRDLSCDWLDSKFRWMRPPRRAVG
jgi:hypothetical protein